VKAEKKRNEIYGSFYLEETEFAINVSSIQEVVNYPERIIPMPLSPTFMVGVFNLRNLIIPIINLKNLLHFEDDKISGEEKIAIVEHQGIRVGLIFDRTSEIIRAKEEHHSLFNYKEGDLPNIISGAIKLDEQRLLQLIDPFALMEIENIPRVAEYQQARAAMRVDRLHSSRKKCISFKLGETTMAFDISGIHEIVKVTEIKQSTFQTESCLGIINLRGQIVPVINFANLLGLSLQSQNDIADKRIIILKLEKELFGLLVDGVENIISYTSEDVIPVPLLFKERTTLFEGCLPANEQNKDKEILLLNHEHVLSNEEILSITHGHSNIYQSGETAKDELRKKTSKREAYISFKLNHLFGISISDVREIINFPEDLLTPPGLPSFVLGMLNLRGEMVTIVDTRNLYEFNDEKNDRINSKVLVFISNNEKFGLVVDSVEDIIHIDSEQKMKVPGLLVQQVKDQFENDIKEIVSYAKDNQRETALIILNINPVTERIKKSMCA